MIVLKVRPNFLKNNFQKDKKSESSIWQKCEQIFSKEKIYYFLYAIVYSC